MTSIPQAATEAAPKLPTPAPRAERAELHPLAARSILAGIVLVQLCWLGALAYVVTLLV